MCSTQCGSVKTSWPYPDFARRLGRDGFVYTQLQEVLVRSCTGQVVRIAINASQFEMMLKQAAMMSCCSKPSPLILAHVPIVQEIVPLLPRVTTLNRSDWCSDSFCVQLLRLKDNENFVGLERVGHSERRDTCVRD